MPNQEDPLTTFNFEVQITVPNASALGIASPLCSMEFAEMDGLEMSMDPKVVREGGSNNRQVNLIGRVSYGLVTFKRGMTSNQDVWKWFAAMARAGDNASANAAGFNSPRASGVVLVKDASGKKDKVRVKLEGCVPVKVKFPVLNAKESGLAIEEMQMAISSFTVEVV